MKLKLFKKYFFTTAFIIFISLSFMLMILSVVLNSYIAENKQESLTKACNEVAKYAERQSDGELDSAFGNFSEILGMISDVSDTDAFIADSETGTVIACGCGSENGENCIHSSATLEKGILVKNSESESVTLHLSTLNLYKKPHYVAQRVIRGSESGKTVTVFATASVSTVQGLLSSVIRLSLAAAVVPVIIMFFCIYAMTWRLTKPLKLMSEASRAMAKGDFSRRIPVTSDDEIGELAASFNMMTNSLAQLEGMRKSFVANVSHELKTPMTTIGGFIDGILDGTIEPDRQRYYLGIVSDEVKRLSRLVQSMLSMARLESGEFALKPELFDLRELVCTIVISHEQHIEQQKIEIKGLDGLQSVSVNADRDLIHQAIYNLVDNAVKFTNSGGSISFSLKTDGKLATLTVTNTGKGIPEKDLPFIFERFYKVDKSRSASKNSTGIGLYIVKTIITSHGGTVAAYSKENEFTSFKLSLPMSK